MPHPPTADLEALLRALVDAGVVFIVVGGAAAVIHGAPVTTQDLDIVPRQHAGDIQRLLSTLTQLDSRFRPIRPGRDIQPTEQHVTGHGQLNLTTRLGPLDLLLRLPDARGYDELLPHSCQLDASGLQLRVIDLPTWIEIKRSTGRARDTMVVPLLLALQALTTRG